MESKKAEENVPPTAQNGESIQKINSDHGGHK